MEKHTAYEEYLDEENENTNLLKKRNIKTENVEYISKYGSIPEKLELLKDSDNLRFKSVYDADPWEGICILVLLIIIGLITCYFIFYFFLINHLIHLVSFHIYVHQNLLYVFDYLKYQDSL